MFLQNSSVISTLTVGEVIKGILSSLILAFIASGISAIYLEERLPIGIAAIIQLIVLYFDYLLIYLLNGWLMTKNIVFFTVIFVIGFAIIWFIIYKIISSNVKKMNKIIEQ
ncbi:MAG: DUF3021 family protein [Eubacterium sp.]